MITSMDQYEGGKSATTADIVRLMGTIRELAGNSSRIEIDVSSSRLPNPRMIVQIVSDVRIGSGDAVCPHVWVQRFLGENVYSISTNTLFEMLITAYRCIETDLAAGLLPKPPLPFEA